MIVIPPTFWHLVIYFLIFVPTCHLGSNTYKYVLNKATKKIPKKFLKIQKKNLSLAENIFNRPL